MKPFNLLWLLGVSATISLAGPPKSTAQRLPSGRYQLPSGASALVYPGTQGPALHLVSDRGEQSASWTRSGTAWRAILPRGELELRSGQGGLVVRVRSRAGARSERWKPTTVRVPVALAVLQGEGAFRVEPEQVKDAMQVVGEQLAAVYGPLGLSFELLPPTPVAAKRVDRDGDGRLAKDEVRRLRDHLERIGLKRPGRVVLTLTQAPIVGSGCRGWTLGDGVATPHTLTDLNDNFSIVAMRFLRGHHTVAHEVGHQFGLDDLGRENRPQLSLPHRVDHLMDSGGEGFFVDPTAAVHMHTVTTHTDLGLAGRRSAHAVSASQPTTADAPSGPQGLGVPPQAIRR